MLCCVLIFNIGTPEGVKGGASGKKKQNNNNKKPCLPVQEIKRHRFDPGSRRSSEKEMETHFSVLAWRIPGTEEPGGL